MGETMQGKRVPWPEGLLAPGEYAKHESGVWYACTPNGEYANLAAHTVTEHEDGTITVSPSILVRTVESAIGSEPYRQDAYDGQLWHGFLERGEWRSC